MKFREPLLGGSAAMPGASLQRACRLLVAVCALHLGVTLVYYLAGRDLRRLPQLVGVRTTLQGSSHGATAIGQPSGELRLRGAAPPPPLQNSSELRSRAASNPDADSRPGPGPGPGSNLTSAPVPSTTTLSLTECPEESPLLGKFPMEVHPCPLPRQTAPLFRIRAPNPQTEVPGWIGVRGWEVSSFGFMEAE